MIDRRRILLLAVLAAAVVAFFALGLHRGLTLDALRQRQDELARWHDERPLATLAAFFAIYVAVTALSIPGALVMTLAAGALFGLPLGVAVVSFASTIGATLAFLSARFLLRDAVRRRFGVRLEAIDRGVASDGPFYLFALRLVPLFPFFLVNVALGLTPMRTRTFYWVSQAGMLAGTIVLVNVGTRLGELASGAHPRLVAPGILLSLAALGMLPLAARRLVAILRTRRLLRRWPRPRRFDYNLVVIGAGSAGLVAAYVAAAVKARVALVEQHRMGGDCLNTGCIPSKALLRSARLLAQIRQAREFGIEVPAARGDFAAVMERVGRVVRDVAPHDSIARYTALGVDCLGGTARIASPWTVAVRDAGGERLLTTRAIVVATGARPFVPPLPGLLEAGCLTSDSVWDLRELPRRLVVLGGGPVGVELAQAFGRLGASVTLVEMAAQLLPREDPDVASLVAARVAQEGIEVLVNHRALRCAAGGDGWSLVASHAGREIAIPFDRILCAAGRVANTAGLGLEALDIPLTPARTIETDATLQTRLPTIYACGDVAGPFQYTHAAAHQAWYAAVNALFGTWRRLRADYRVVPATTFTEPEVARVGLNEVEAQRQGVAHEVTLYRLADLDRAIADGATDGFVKVLTPPGSDRILGATIVGAHAGDLLAEYVLAMQHRIGLKGILGTIHAYPTLAEAGRHAAGAWRRAQVTRGQWALLAALQSWRRGQSGLGRVAAALSGALRDRRRAYADAPH